MNESAEIVALVEGKTEGIFISKLLAPHLARLNVYMTPIIISKPGEKGGDVRFGRVKNDIGLHLIIARRMGGASRALYEPILQTFNELGVTGILLSGDPEEGAVIGRIRPVKSAPGRAQIISRDAGHVIAQLAWAPPRTPGSSTPRSPAR